MGTRIYLKKPITPTKLALKTLRTRISLGETQAEFARHFRVSYMTIHNWETGRTNKIQEIHREILDGLILDLKRKGLYISEEFLAPIFKDKMDKFNDKPII